MAAPRKYPDELRERAVRMTLEARKDPATRPSACKPAGEQVSGHRVVGLLRAAERLDRSAWREDGTEHG